MLSVLHWFVGCWHEWDKWEDILATTTYFEGEKAAQKRYCKKCGKSVWR